MKASKKIMSLMLSAMLVLFACAAFAESSLFEETYIDPDTYDFSQANWVEVDGTFRFARPDTWSQVDCGEAEEEQGAFYKMESEDGSATVTAFVLGADGEYSQHFVSESEAYSYLVEQNGLPATYVNFGDALFGYGYYAESMDTLFVVVPYDDGITYVLSFTPTQNAETSEILQAIFYSIRPVEAS